MTHYGHDGFIRSIEDWESAWSDYSFDLEELIGIGDRVVVILHTTAIGRTSGLKLDRRDAQVYEVRDGKVVRLDCFSSKGEALEAAGIPSSRPALPSHDRRLLTRGRSAPEGALRRGLRRVARRLRQRPPGDPSRTPC